MKPILTAISLMVLIPTVGCQREEKKVSIRGTVTRNGEPLVWKSENSLLIVLFAPMDREKNREVYRGETDREQGTYTIAAIPPGEYTVSVQMMDPAPGIDLLQYQFELGNSSIRKTITQDGEVIDIDLPKELPKGKGTPKMPKKGS